MSGLANGRQHVYPSTKKNSASEVCVGFGQGNTSFHFSLVVTSTTWISLVKTLHGQIQTRPGTAEQSHWTALYACPCSRHVKRMQYILHYSLTTSMRKNYKNKSLAMSIKIINYVGHVC